MRFFQQIMRYFLVNYAPKILNYANCLIFLSEFFFSIYLACKSSLVLLLTQNYPLSKQKKVVLLLNESKQGAASFSEL